MTHPTKLASPIPAPGCYSLHLYCDHDNSDHGFSEMPWQVDQFQTGGEARRFARAKGWRLHRDGTATCPKCVRALKPGSQS